MKEYGTGFGDLLGDVRVGIESEALRILPDGTLAPTAHPFPPGNRRFTKDFAESQLEIVTPPAPGPGQAYDQLKRLAEEAREAIRPELLWPFSMPPALPPDEDIAIADFGDTDDGRKARLYRIGLAARYGTARQMISGVHVNISAGPELTGRLNRMGEGTSLLSAAGEFYRSLPSLVLLSGASPVQEAEVGGETSVEPVVSIRNGRSGYGSDVHRAFIDISSTDAYRRALEAGIRKESPCQGSRKLVDSGRVLQLSKSVFQKESEYYAPLRLRRSLGPGASESVALRRGGPDYIELRFFDRNPGELGGLDEDTLRLVHLVFLRGLLRAEAPPDRRELNRILLEVQQVADARLETVTDPLESMGRHLRFGAAAMLTNLNDLADRMDRLFPGGGYGESLHRWHRRLDRPWGLPSAAVYREFKESGTSWTAFGASLAEKLSKEVADGLSVAGV